MLCLTVISSLYATFDFSMISDRSWLRCTVTVSYSLLWALLLCILHSCSSYNAVVYQSIQRILCSYYRKRCLFALNPVINHKITADHWIWSSDWAVCVCLYLSVHISKPLLFLEMKNLQTINPVKKCMESKYCHKYLMRESNPLKRIYI